MRHGLLISFDHMDMCEQPSRDWRVIRICSICRCQDGIWGSWTRWTSGSHEQRGMNVPSYQLFSSIFVWPGCLGELTHLTPNLSPRWSKGARGVQPPDWWEKSQRSGKVDVELLAMIIQLVDLLQSMSFSRLLSIYLCFLVPPCFFWECWEQRHFSNIDGMILMRSPNWLSESSLEGHNSYIELCIVTIVETHGFPADVPLNQSLSVWLFGLCSQAFIGFVCFFGVALPLICLVTALLQLGSWCLESTYAATSC